MRTLTISLYFTFAIIILASFGVSLPLCFDYINGDPNILRNLNQNIVTYFTAILISASLDYVIKLIDDNISYKKTAILAICIVIAFVFLMITFILYKNSKGLINGISFLAILGVILSYIIWWIANFRNSAFNISSTLGGNTDKPLKDGK